MKKTCKGCRALSHRNTCLLGYKVAKHEHPTLPIKETAPAEECPKPMTSSKYIKLKYPDLLGGMDVE